MPLRKLRSLKARLFAIVCLAMLPTLCMALLMALDRYDEAKQASLAHSQQVARSYSEDGRALFDQAKTLLARMALEHAAHQPGGPQCAQALSLQSRLNPSYGDMALSLPDGRLVCGAPGAGGSMAARPWFREALRDRGLVVGRLLQGPEGKGGRLPLAMAVRGQDGKVRAVLTMTLDVSQLSDILDDQALPQGAAATIIDRHGLIVARYPHAPSSVGRAAPQANGFLPDLMANGQISWESEGVDGVRRVYFLAPLLQHREHGLYLRVGMPTDTVFAGARAELVRNLMLLGTMACMALLLTWLFSNALVLRHVQRLWQATRKLAEGDFSHRIGSAGTGELAELAMAFDTMAGALEQHTALLLRAERKYRDVFDNSVSGLFQSTPEGAFRQANPAMARMLGFESPEEMLERVTDMGSQMYLDPAARRELLEQLAQRGEVSGFQICARRADGESIWLSLNVRAILEGDGSVRYYEGAATDITYRRVMEENLRAKQEKLQGLLDNSPTLIAIKDAEGRYVMTNVRHREAHGLTQECIGKTVEELYPPEEARLIREEDAQVLAAGHSMNFRRILTIRRGGETQKRHFLVVKFPLCDDARQVCRVCSIAYDVTDYEQVREALRQSEEKYRTMIQTSPDLIWLLDPEGRIQEANNASRELLGYDPEELRGMDFRLLFDVEVLEGHDRERVLPRFVGLGRGHGRAPKLINERRQPPRATSQLEVRLIPKGSSICAPRHFELSSCGLWRGMAFLGTMVVIRDTTERRKAEEDLRESRELLAHTQAIGGIGGFSINLETRERKWTDELRHLLGVEGEYLPDFDECEAFVAPEDRTLYREAVRRAEELGEGFDLELKMARTDAGQRWVRFVGRRTDREGARILAGTVQDISDRKSLEALRDDIDNIIRHDLKSPLNGIINLPRLIIEDDNLTPEQAEYLLFIEQSGRKMLRQVEMSLDIMKIERGRFQVAPEPLDLLAVLHDILGGMQDAFNRKGCSARLELDGRTLDSGVGSGGAFVAMGEERLCSPLFSNLLQNALEASPPGGTVRIGLARGAELSVRIRNLGEVPPEIRERFFEKYVTSGKVRGTGLGTYSASLFARVQGGDVLLDCTEPGATTVEVRLPGVAGVLVN